VRGACDQATGFMAAIARVEPAAGDPYDW
jgi:hypothetical protein